MKNALITGCSSGIGKSTAEIFIKNGYKVFGIDRIACENTSIQFLEADLAKDLIQIKNWIQKNIQTLDCVIHCAAIQVCSSINNVTESDFENTMSINIRAPILISQYCIPALSNSSNASIVCISSVHAHSSSKDISIYAASKGALSAWVRAASLEFAEKKIRINSICPGAIATPMLDAGLSRSHVAGKSISERRDSLSMKHPLKRIGEPNEIADAVLFLTQASFMTGSELIIDGGALARLSTE